MSRDVAATSCTVISAQSLDFFQQKDVGRLGHRDGEDALDQKQRQNQCFSRNSLGRIAMTFGSAMRRRDARVGHAIRLRQRLGDLVFRAEAQLDEDFAEQLLVIASPLLVERALQLLRLDQALVKQQLAERFSCGGGNHMSSDQWSMSMQ